MIGSSSAAALFALASSFLLKTYMFGMYGTTVLHDTAQRTVCIRGINF